MKYSEFQLTIRKLSREDLTKSQQDEISITALAQKESELLENLIHHQQNTQVAKVRLLHEIDECLRDFDFFESHALRELDRAKEISIREQEKVIADAMTGNRRTIPDYWQIVRDIISGVEGGIILYFEVLEKYFPEELGKYSAEKLLIFLPYFSTHRKHLGGIPIEASRMKNFETKLEQFEYWQENIAPHVQDGKAAAEYWGVPEYLLQGSLHWAFKQIGFVPKQVYERIINAWFGDTDIKYKVSREAIKAGAGLSFLIEKFEKKIAAISKYGIADFEHLVDSELAECDRYNFNLVEEEINLNVNSRYWNRTLYHEFYRGHLLKRLDEVSAPTAPVALIPTATSELDSRIRLYGFFDLPKVATLSLENQQKLVRLLNQNRLPYQVAMLAELDFIRYLKEYHFTTGSKVNSEIAKWLGTAARSIKGNISVLSERSNEDKTRYTAHLHKDQVKEDYQNLK